MSSTRLAVFLDRDGVINRAPQTGEYITSSDDLELLPGVGPSIARLNAAGFLVLVATNQRCLARGLLSPTVLAEIHQRIKRSIAFFGGRIDAFYVCPHEVSDQCACRKPRPGMLLRAAEEFQLDLSKCWMVGDSSKDVEAGFAAGCRTVLVGTHGLASPDFRATGLEAAVDIILAHA